MVPVNRPSTVASAIILINGLSPLQYQVGRVRGRGEQRTRRVARRGAAGAGAAGARIWGFNGMLARGPFGGSKGTRARACTSQIMKRCMVASNLSRVQFTAYELFALLTASRITDAQTVLLEINGKHAWLCREPDVACCVGGRSLPAADPFSEPLPQPAFGTNATVCPLAPQINCR